jgi:hypothetical protein
VTATSTTIATDVPVASRVAIWLPPLLFAVGFAWVFRRWLFNGFDGAFGDEADGYLALAIIEHWRHVFAGSAYWSDPIFFYPARGTLGYTDALFLAVPFEKEGFEHQDNAMLFAAVRGIPYRQRLFELVS